MGKASVATTGDQAEAPTPSYEQAREELVDIVRRLEAGGGPLEESLRLWERGEELARICQEWLDGARARLEAAGQAPVEVEDLDEEETSDDGDNEEDGDEDADGTG